VQSEANNLVGELCLEPLFLSVGPDLANKIIITGGDCFLLVITLGDE
jgi:hypothetical protein